MESKCFEIFNFWIYKKRFWILKLFEKLENEHQVLNSKTEQVLELNQIWEVSFIF